MLNACTPRGSVSTTAPNLLRRRDDHLAEATRRAAVVGAWGDILGDTTVAAAMLDRLLHRSVVINLDGNSYRLRDHNARNEQLRRTTTGTRQPLR